MISLFKCLSKLTSFIFSVDIIDKLYKKINPAADPSGGDSEEMKWRKYVLLTLIISAFYYVGSHLGAIYFPYYLISINYVITVCELLHLQLLL